MYIHAAAAPDVQVYHNGCGKKHIMTGSIQVSRERNFAGLIIFFDRLINVSYTVANDC